MIELATMGFPYRVAAVAVGTAMAAEGDGAHAVWFPERVAAAPDAALWRRVGGPLADMTPDPSDAADPVVHATAALLATRRLRVGVLGLDLAAAGPERAARTIATLGELGGERAVVGIAAGPGLADRGARLRALREQLDARSDATEVVVCAPDDATVELAGEHGWGWLATTPEGVAALAARATRVPGGGAYLPFVAHEDGSVARKAVDGPLLVDLATHDDAADAVVGTPTDVLEVVRELAAAGLRRVVLDNLLPLGLPEELEGARAATRVIVRSARLELRGPA